MKKWEAPQMKKLDIKETEWLNQRRGRTQCNWKVRS
jgi:hypothetical protein